MSLAPKEVDELRQHIDELEARITELESNTRVVECKELHILDAEGNRLISLSVNEENSGEILIRSASGKSGVQILGKDQYGGGYLEVFKDFSETLEPFCLPRRDAVRIRINKEILGGGGNISTAQEIMLQMSHLARGMAMLVNFGSKVNMTERSREQDGLSWGLTVNEMKESSLFKNRSTMRTKTSMKWKQLLK